MEPYARDPSVKREPTELELLYQEAIKNKKPIEKYGTSEGAKLGWDKRGRGTHEKPRPTPTADNVAVGTNEIRDKLNPGERYFLQFRWPETGQPLIDKRPTTLTELVEIRIPKIYPGDPFEVLNSRGEVVGRGTGGDVTEATAHDQWHFLNPQVKRVREGEPTLRYENDETSDAYKWHPEAQEHVIMSPRDFLDRAAPYTRGKTLDEILAKPGFPFKPESFENLKSRMVRHQEIDPLWLNYETTTDEYTRHEGRHRALAAMALGIADVPVIVYHLRSGEYVPASNENKYSQHFKKEFITKYGTSEGVRRAWDTRGRGTHEKANVGYIKRPNKWTGSLHDPYTGRDAETFSSPYPITDEIITTADEASTDLCMKSVDSVFSPYEVKPFKSVILAPFKAAASYNGMTQTLKVRTDIFSPHYVEDLKEEDNKYYARYGFHNTSVDALTNRYNVDPLVAMLDHEMGHAIMYEHNVKTIGLDAMLAARDRVRNIKGSTNANDAKKAKRDLVKESDRLHTTPEWIKLVKKEVKNGWNLPSKYAKTSMAETWAECRSLWKHGATDMLTPSIISYISDFDNKMRKKE